MFRYATEEDYKRLQNWNVGTFHRASTLPETEASSGEPDEQQKLLHEKFLEGSKDLFPEGLQLQEPPRKNDRAKKNPLEGIPESKE